MREANPIVDTIKLTWKNRQEVIDTARDIVTDNFRKVAADSRVMNSYVYPFLESDRTRDALKSIQQRLHKTAWADRIERFYDLVLSTKPKHASRAHGKKQKRSAKVRH